MGVNCRQCIYFKISWDKNRPYACKAFGFKTKTMPSVEVYNADGRECLKFFPKTQGKNNRSNK